MRWTILGSGNGVPTATRGCPGHLLHAAGEIWLVDPGPGSLAAAARHGVAAGDVDGVLLSHYHLDHHLDLAALIFAHFDPSFAGRPPLRVLGPPGLLALRDAWRAAWGHWIEPTGRAVDWREVEPGPQSAGALTARAVAVHHGSRPAYGWRLREAPDGPVLAYSGDTGEGPGAVDCGHDADLFLLECTLPPGAATETHLTAAAAGRVAAAAGCRRLVLVHFSPAIEGTDPAADVRRSWNGPLVLGHDGLVLDLPLESGSAPAGPEREEDADPT